VTAPATPAATVATPAVTVAATANGKIKGQRNGEKYTRPWKPGPVAIAGATVMKISIVLPIGLIPNDPIRSMAA